MSNTPVTKNYKSDLEEALRDLLSMVTQRETLETRIAKQKKRIAALYELVETDEGSLAIFGLVEGITDACRIVLRAAEKPLVVSEIRDRVQTLGLPQQANLLASVHTTLKRMKDAGEVTEMTVPLSTGGTGVAYKWVSPALRMADLVVKGNFAGAYGIAGQTNASRRRHAMPRRRRSPLQALAELTKKPKD